MFDRDPGLPRCDVRGDMGSTAWAPSFDDLYNHQLKGLFTAEAIEMVPGTLLYVFYVLLITSSSLTTGVQITTAKYTPLCAHHGAHNHPRPTLLHGLLHSIKCT